MKTRVYHSQDEHKRLLIAAAILHFNPPNIPWTASLIRINRNAPDFLKLGEGTIYTNSKKWFSELQSYPKEFYIKSVEPPQEIVTKPTTDTLENFLDEFSTEISLKLFDRIKVKLENHLRIYKDTWKPSNGIQELVTGKKLYRELKKKILIVGLLPVQQQEITKFYGDIFRIRYHESEENIHRLEDRVKWSDTIILNCTKISHSHQEMVKKFSNGRDVKLIFGGTSGIKGALEGIKLQCQSQTNQ